MLSGRVRKTYGRRNPQPKTGSNSDSDTETDEPGSSRTASTSTQNGSSSRKEAGDAGARDPDSEYSNGTPSSSSALSRMSRLSGNNVGSSSSSSSSSSLRRPPVPGSVNTPPPLKRRRTVDASLASTSMPPPAMSKPTTPTSSSRGLRPRNSPMPASPRDLSALFAAVSPAQSSKSDDGAPAPPRRRKMLSKAQSMVVPPSQLSASQEESEVETSRPPLQSSQSLPITPSKKDRDLDGEEDEDEEREQTPPRALAPLPEPSSGGARRTYGKGRSYLASAVERPEDEPRESYAELRKRYEVDNGEHSVLDGLTGARKLGGSGTESMMGLSGGQGNLIDELMMAKAPESVSDMRSKGENRQFMDEVAYYLEGLGGAPALRRTSALDILGSMQREAEWVSKMNVCGQTEPVFEALAAARGDDVIMETACLLFLYMVVQAGISVEQLLYGQPAAAMKVLGQGLGIESGPLDKSYASKITMTITNLRNIGASVEHEDESPPTRQVASFVLSQILENPDRWPHLKPAFEEEGIVSLLLKRIGDELSPLRERMELYSKGLDLLPKDSSVSLRTVEYCLEALSRHRIVLLATEYDALFSALVVFAAALTDEDEELRVTAARCTVLALEVLTPAVSLSRVRKVDAEVVAALGRVLLLRESICEDVGVESVTVANIQSYVLAIFGSLALASEKNVALLSNTYVSDCRKRSCAQQCRCSPQPLSYHLGQLYVSSASSEDSDSSVSEILHGYLALLVAKVLVHAHFSPTGQESLYAVLPGSGPSDKARGVLDTLRDFNSVNEEFVKRLAAGEGEQQHDETIAGITLAIEELEAALD